jgi:hypothetical protein
MVTNLPPGQGRLLFRPWLLSSSGPSAGRGSSGDCPGPRAMRGPAANMAAKRGGNSGSRGRRSPVTTGKCTGGESNPYALRRRNLKPGADEGSFTIVQDSASSVNEKVPDGEPSCGVLPRGPAAGEVDPVDVALARALADASTAGRFDVVLQLAKELEARRLERLATVQLRGRENEEERP